MPAFPGNAKSLASGGPIHGRHAVLHLPGGLASADGARPQGASRKCLP
jgi:hypothetical protein